MTDEEKLEIKRIWEQHRGKLTVSQIFRSYMTGFFNVPADGVTPGNAEFMRFMVMTRTWRQEERRIQRKIGAESLTDEEMEKINETNAKELTILLQNLISDYRHAPEKFKQLAVGDISKLYQIIEKIQTDREKVEIARNKLKLETAKTFLPYTRMSLPEMIETRDLIVKSIDRLISEDEKNKLPSGQSGEGAELQRIL